MIHLYEPGRKSSVVLDHRYAPQHAHHIRMQEMRAPLRFRAFNFDVDTAISEVDADGGNWTVAMVAHDDKQHGKGFGDADIDVGRVKAADRGFMEIQDDGTGRDWEGGDVGREIGGGAGWGY